MPRRRLVSCDWDHEVPRDEVAQQSVECFDRDLLISHSSPSFFIHQSFTPYAATDLDGTKTMFSYPAARMPGARRVIRARPRSQEVATSGRVRRPSRRVAISGLSTMNAAGGSLVRMNREWHERHRLATGASLEERVRWHLEHAEVCGCRPIPQPVVEEIERRGLTLDQND
jgi:hypothetical protein